MLGWLVLLKEGEYRLREQPVLPQAEVSTGLEVCFEAARTLSEGGLQCW